MITKTLSSGKDIIILDDIFSIEDVVSYEEYAMRCLYSLKASTSSRFNTRSNDELFFGADLSQEDLNRFNIFNNREFQKISNIFTGSSMLRSWILCTAPLTKYLYHADHKSDAGLTFLYYLNTFWHPEWGGETLFCDKAGDPEIAIACKPNRAVIFPSNVLHKPSGTSCDARLRFTFTSTFLKNEINTNVWRT